MKRYVDCLFLKSLLIVGLLSSSIIHAQEGNWRLDIDLAKTQFIIYEPIWLDATLTNITSDSLRTHGIVAPHHYQFFIEITDSSGNVLDYHGPMWSSVSGPGGVLLEAGEPEYECFDLLEFYFVGEGSSGLRISDWRFPFMPTGRYSVQAHFEGLGSNHAVFEIVEPEGEELDALELVAEASSLWRKKDTDASGRKYQEFVDRFPNSVFAEKCLRAARSFTDNALSDFFRGVGTFDRNGLRRELIERFPNSGSTGSWLTVLTYEMDQAEKTRVLNDAIEAHPNTRSAKFAKQMHKKILREKKGEN